MPTNHTNDFRCPHHGTDLHSPNPGSLCCPQGCTFEVVAGIPNFIGTLSDIEASTQAEYDRVAEDIYDVAVDWQFASMYEDENRMRESMVDILGVGQGMKVLDVGCGTGRDSFRLARRIGTGGHLHMQDISPRMVHVCAHKMAEYDRTMRFGCGLDYSVSSVTSLPFPDDHFDAVFHFGGFNQFGDLAKGASELTRVVKPGGRVLFGDEAVAPWLKGSEFERIVVTNNPLFAADVPLHVLPAGARDVQVRWIMANCFYIIAFTKGDGPPPLDLDLPHKGWRGGTMRSRYFGQLEGVTPEAKALAREAAVKAGVSIHEWLDRLVKTAAQDKTA